MPPQKQERTFAVNFISRSVEKPMQENINNVKHILKYLKSNISQGIKFQKNRNLKLLQAYLDADYAGAVETRRSITDFIIVYDGG